MGPRYVIQKLLGEGGLGRVYAAWDQERKRAVALKILKPEIDSAGLTEEFRLLCSLSHANLVEIFDYHGEASGLLDDSKLHGPCFTMELLEGQSLDSLGKPDSADLALKALGDAASALQYLHSRNILHRDLKPSNLLWDGEKLRLLDFGLASTPAYSPPEALWGEYDETGDLFGLGLAFFEWLSGRFPFPAWPPASGRLPSAPSLSRFRPELPEFFSDLLKRLLEISPSRRLSSASSMLRFLRRHGLENRNREATTEFPRRLAWQEPDAVAQACRQALAGNTGKSFVVLLGPSGCGRSRLLEELRWEHQLAGGEWHSIPPEEAGSWRPTAPSLSDSLGRLLGAGPSRALAFEDFHQWPESARREVLLLMKLAEERDGGPCFFLDLNQDFETSELRAWRKQIATSPRVQILELPELSRDQAQGLLDSAPLEKKPGHRWVEKWIRQCGGRPLLLVESLRRAVSDGFSDAALEGSAPERLGAACRRQVESLSEAARRLFAAFLTVEPPLDLSSIADLARSEDWQENLAELDRRSLLRLDAKSRGSRSLAQASLRPQFLAAFSSEEIRSSHRAWLRYRLGHASEASGELAPEIARHAAAAGEKDLAKTWGLAAAEFHEKREEPEAALACYRRLLPFAESSEERYVLQGSMAPLLHKLGRFAEARDAYAQWIADRPDDESRLQRCKFHLFMGMVDYSAGEMDRARAEFEKCLEIGPLGRPSHRSYHARALNFLAALEKREGRPEEARRRLEAALPLAGGDFILRGELEQRLGELEQSLGNFASALEHFIRNLEFFRKAGNPQSEAVSFHLLGLWCQEYGRLAEAELSMDRSLILAKAGGAVLQGARYLQNRAFLHLEMARYGQAWEEMREAGKILEVYGNEEDLRLSRLHRAEFHSRIGNSEAARSALKEMKAGGSDIFLQRARLLRRTGRIEEAEKDFCRAIAESAASSLPLRVSMAMDLLSMAAAGNRLARHQELLQSTRQSLAGMAGPLHSACVKALEFWSADPRLWTGLLPGLLAAIHRIEAPETRRELVASSAMTLARNDLRQCAKILWQMQEEEGRRIAANLPEEIKMEYEKNLEAQTLDEELKKILGSPPPPASPLTVDHRQTTPSPGLSEQRFRQFSEIARQIAGKDGLAEVLERVMDAAIELTGAERGFLLLENPKSASPLAGFEVKTARHFNQQAMGGEELQISMTALRQAMERGSTLLTANAQLDERLKGKQSVVQYQLKSILAVPLELEGRVLGAIYLDHRYTPDCFREEDAVLLDSFSAQAALAIQKARFIAELKQANARLEEKVETQSQRIEALSVELARVRDELRYGYDEIIGQSPKMMEVFHLLDHVSDTLIPVWIYGESGTGKELVARSLHENSARKKGPLITINCCAIPETLLESELFGHKRGAFTHADRDRVGLFEQASGGTLFMDEVADMSLAMQVKLLRVLQEGEVRPLGAAKSTKVDVRLVTASNRDLQQLVAEEKFRQDLFFRINGITIGLPPLRERKEDIPLLASHLMQKLAKAFKLEPSKLSEEAYEKLLGYSWPGNIRQLESVLRNTLLFAQGAEIGPQLLNLPPEVRPGLIGGRSVTESTPRSREKAEERRLILEALRRHKMDKAAAARDLDVTLRCLYMRMDRHGIPKNKSVLAKFLGLKA